jgi:CheY-like chemotaxis protein
LAEDNPANQKLMEYVLQGRGHRIEIAENGQEAVAKLAESDFDVVLMDVQMPIMDGYQATAAIRALADPAKARLPIVAITAHAMREYAQRCLSAGMDACITKPICATELIELVERLAASAAATGGVQPARVVKEWNSPPQTAAEPSTAAFDLDEARKRCFDKQMFSEMVEYFFADSVEILEKLRDALRNGNAEDVARIAHRFRGTAIYLSATPTIRAADRVEKAGDSGDLTVAAEAFRELESQVEILKQALGPHRRNERA